MARTRRSFTLQFKQEAVALTRQPDASVASVARSLGIGAGTLQYWIDHPPQAAPKASRGGYGSPRVTVDLNEAGVAVCENTVAMLMRQAGIQVKAKRRYVPRTTDSNHEHPIAPNRLDRDFAASAPDRKWTCDI